MPGREAVRRTKAATTAMSEAITVTVFIRRTARVDGGEMHATADSVVGHGERR
jgi:hypothetical protein